MIGRKHVPAHLWAQLDRLPASRVADLESHADRCDRCDRARARVLEARRGFDAIAEAEAPELEWDHIRARIHWSRSLARRTGEREAIEALEVDPRDRRPLVWAGALVAATAALAALFLWSPWSASVPSLAGVEAPAPQTIEAVPIELAEAHPLPAMIVFARGEVTIDEKPPSYSSLLAAGAVLRTGDGAVTLQFGADSGLALGPRSSLELRSLDSQSIELVLDGVLDVQVSERQPGQQFVVVAGPRSVTVRGTGFRVEHRGGALDVRCEHGRVDVTDGVTNRAVPARVGLALAAGADLLDDADVGPIGRGDLEALSASLTMPLLPAWTNAKTALESSSMLDLTAPAGQDVRIDGAPIGRGSLAVRLLSGRHQVMVGTRGAWGKGRWLELDGAGSVAVDTTAGAGKTADRGEADAAATRIAARRRELRGLLSRTSRLRRCVRGLAEHGVADGTYARFEVGVNADGSFSFVNIASSNVNLQARACLLDALGSLSLSPGPAARLALTWRY